MEMLADQVEPLRKIGEDHDNPACFQKSSTASASQLQPAPWVFKAIWTPP